MKRQVLFVTWLLMFLLALGSIGFVAQGLMRDFYTGDPVATVDLRMPAAWKTVPFRVWGPGVYDLYISSVNHDSAQVGRRFHGTLAVRIKAPSSTTVFERMYGADTLDHRIPLNYGDNRLATITLDDRPWRRWELQVRVVDGDPKFQPSITQVKLRKQRYDPGMGGLMNYAMILPAGVFMLLALGFSIPLANVSGWVNKVPLTLSAIIGLGALFLIVGI